MYWAWISSHISILCEGWDWVGWMISIGFRKVKVLSLQWLNPKFYTKFEDFWQFGNIMVECDIWMYVWRFFLCIYVDNFEQLSAPIMNFVQLSATFANALHIVLCQIVWCQIVLKSSKCSNVHIFKRSTFPMFQCSNVQMLKC